MNIPTSAKAEDPAAVALMRLIQAGYGRRLALIDICRELLRGPLAEVAEPGAGRSLGGYCMRTPTDPTLREIARVGARLVELSYTSPNAVEQAKGEAVDLVRGLTK